MEGELDKKGRNLMQMKVCNWSKKVLHQNSFQTSSTRLLKARLLLSKTLTTKSQKKVLYS